MQPDSFKFKVGQIVKHKANASYESRFVILVRYRDIDHADETAYRRYEVSYTTNGSVAHAWMYEEEIESIDTKS